MKRHLRPLIERALRRMPVARAAYWRGDALQAQLDALQARQPVPATPLFPPPDADPHQLEHLTPFMRTTAERVRITLACRDADALPKVPAAGRVTSEGGVPIQTMHNGVRMLAGGYYGDWMQDLITRCRGHHEPQEVLLFTEVLRHLPAGATMMELGGHWSFYSVWFLSRVLGGRSVVVEPDPAYLQVGRTNAGLNGCSLTFVNAFAGAADAPPAPFQTESSGMVELPCVSVSGLMAAHGISHLDLLHCDAQGVELAVVESIAGLAAAGRIGWLVMSTHAHHIRKDPLTHQRCLAALQRMGATILAEHDVQESFSGDGLIVARFGAVPDGWANPRLSFNRSSQSLFRNPLHDLALANAAPAQPPAEPWALLEGQGGFAPAGALLALKAPGPLGPVGSTVLLRFDTVMYPSVAAHGEWNLGVHAALDPHIAPDRPYVLLDISANVGLFTRQAMVRYPNTGHAVCVEPEPGNFRALQHNLHALGPGRAAAWNLALSDRDGSVQFFGDRENTGNYSLNDDAMRGRPFDTVGVQARHAGDCLRAHAAVPDGAGLIWKSDTQDYDELIVSLAPDELWARVSCAVVELWRIRKPAFDRAAFARRVDAFPNRSIGMVGQHSTDAIMGYLDGDDWQHEDLYLWR